MVEPTPLTKEAFPAYREHNIRHYGRGKLAAGVWSEEEAEGRAAADVDGLPPEGVAKIGITCSR